MSEERFVFAAAPYSNAAPLVEYLDAEMIYDHPARLVDVLNAGRADAALIPVVDLFRHPELTMFGGLGVSANGPVKSVLLKCSVPLEQVRTVAKDPASATSNALTRVLLEKHFKVKAQMVELTDADAHVVIGDRALSSGPAPCGEIDLAEAWKDMTGLPFVFAVWACRRDFPQIEALEQEVSAAFERGRSAVGRIAARYADRLQVPEPFFANYLENVISYPLGSEELEGLKRFRLLASDGNEQ